MYCNFRNYRALIDLETWLGPVLVHLSDPAALDMFEDLLRVT